MKACSTPVAMKATVNPLLRQLPPLFGSVMVLASLGSASLTAQTIANSGFETPALAANTFSYRTTGAGWTFTGGAGISRNGSAFHLAGPAAPQGSQVLFLQNGAGVAERTVNITTAGTYRISLKTAQRPNNEQGVRILFDGVQIDRITPPNKNYISYTTADVYLAAGNRMLRLEGGGPVSGDNTIFIDDLSIQKVSNAQNWSNPATWGGTVPAAGSHVEIPAGKIVVLDQNVVADSIIVRGTLRFARQALTVQACSIIADGPTARIEIGTEQSRFLNPVTITLTGGVCTAPTACTCATVGHEMTDGNVISSINGGVLDIHGRNMVSWTKLNASIAPGGTFLTLAEPVTWPVGAEILITSSTTEWDQSETRTVKAVTNGGLTVELNTGVTHAHAGVQQPYSRPDGSRTWNLDLRAEVALLSRNIKIQGGADSAIPGNINEGFGGHLMIMKSGSTVAGDTGFVQGGRGYIEGAEFFRMGRKSVKGKYPLHFHMLGEEGKGQYFRNNSVHRSYNRAVVIHGTESTLVEKNACYDHIGHGLMLEDGSERFNRILSNLVALTRRPIVGEEVTPSDVNGDQLQRRAPSSYWITNPNNIVDNNVAAGTSGTGIWLLFPRFTVGLSALDPRFKNHVPSKEPLGSMKGNVVHSSGTAFDISDGLTAEHEIDNNQNTQFPGGIVVENGTAYACNLGLYTGLADGGRADLVTFKGFIMADHNIHMMMAQNALITDTLAVANTGLNLLLRAPNADRVKRVFHLSYDGPARLKKLHLVGFDAADATIFGNVGGAFKHTNAPFEDFTFDHSGTPRSTLTDYSRRLGGTGPQHYADPRRWMMVLRDVDGSVSGKANTSIVTNHPFVRVATDFRPANWTNTYRSDRKFAFVMLNPRAPYGDFADMTITREKSGEAPVPFYYSHFYEVLMEAPLIVNENYFYTFQLHTLPAEKIMDLRIGDVAINDFITVRFRDLAKLAGIEVASTSGDPLVSVVSNLTLLNQATKTTYFKDTATGDLWVKFFCLNDTPHDNTRLRISWTGTPTTNTITQVDTDGDGAGDYQEALGTGDYITGVRDPMSPKDLLFGFNTPGDLEGWVPTNTTSAVAAAPGQLVAQAANNDPFISRNGFSFKGTDVPELYVRYKSNASGRLQLYWANQDGGISAARTVSATAIYTANSGFKIAKFDLSSNTGWIGKRISSLRIDMLGSAGASTTLDWIKADLGTTDSDKDGRADIAELSTGGDPENAADLRFEFNTDDDFEGFTLNNTSVSAVTGGSLVATAGNALDPLLVRPGVNFASSELSSLSVRYRSTASGTLQLYWANENGGFSQARFLNASSAYTANSGYQIATFDLSAHPEWAGKTISALRFDLIGTNGDKTWVDYIRGNGATTGAASVVAGPSLSPDELLKPSLSAEEQSSGMTRAGLGIDAQAGVTYRLMASPDLSPGSWSQVNEYTPEAPERIELQYDTSAPKQFYRIEFERP